MNSILNINYVMDECFFIFNFSCTNKITGQNIITSIKCDHLIIPKENETKIDAFNRVINEKFKELLSSFNINWMSVCLLKRGIVNTEIKFKDIDYYNKNIKLFISMDDLSHTKTPGLMDTYKGFRIDVLEKPIIWLK